MKRFLSMIFVSALTSIFAISSYADYSGKTETVNYDFKDFSAIVASNIFDVELTPSDSYSVSIECSVELKEYLDVYVNHNTLYLSLKNVTFKNMKGALAEVKVTMPKLESVNLSGSARLRANGTFINLDKSVKIAASGSAKISAIDIESHEIRVSLDGSTEMSSILKGDDVELEISGASKITSKVVSEELEIDNSGATRVEVYGSCDRLDIETSGASSVHAYELEAKRVDAEISGTSKGEVYVTDYLEVELSGISTLTYKDDGSIELNNKEIGRGSKLKKEN